MNLNNKLDYISVSYLLALCLTLTYAGIFIYPYLRADDTLLVYSWLHFKMFDTGMGRPIFWYLNDINAYLFTIIGRQSILIFRLAGLGSIIFSALLWNKWFTKWQLEKNLALAATLGIFMLPSYQIIIGNGCWLAPEILLAFFSGMKLYELAYNNCLKTWHTIIYMFFILICFSTYQIIGFLPALVSLVPLIWGNEKNPNETHKRFIAAIKLLTLIALVFSVYYLSWQLALKLIHPSMGGADYLPIQKNGIIKNIIDGFRLLLSIDDLNWPVGIISNLWVIERHFDVISIVFILLISIGILRVCYHQTLYSIILKLSGIVLVLLSQYSLFWLLDDKYHMGRYTTVLGLVTGFALLATNGLDLIIHSLAKKHSSKLWLALIFILTLGTSFNFNRYIVLPSISENLSAKMQVALFNSKVHSAISVKLSAGLVPQHASREFIFTNQSPGYAWHLVRSYLTENRLNEKIPIRILSSEGKVLATYNNSNEDIWHSERVLVIDFATTAHD